MFDSRSQGWHPNLQGRQGPTYRAIADALMEDVQRGALSPGTQLPTHRELAYRLGVTVGTVSKAYAEVQRFGLLTGETGRGSFVANGNEFSTLGEHRIPSQPSVVDLSLNYPATAGIEDAIIRGTLQSIARRSSIRELLGYQHNGATAPQRAAAARWLEHSGLQPSPDQVVVTCGAQHALMACLATLCEPGDTVLTEALSYPGIRALAIMQRLRLKGLPMDNAGLIPETFEAACDANQARVLYTIPTAHNPTTSTLTLERRQAITKIAQRHGVIIVEDDIYGFLLPERPPTIASLAPEQTVYVTSTSKILAPGLRVGFALPPRHLVTRLAAMVRSTVWMTAPAMVECFRVLVEGDDALKLAKARLTEANARQALATEYLEGQTWLSEPYGFHLWLRLPTPWTGHDFVGQARSRGVVLLSSEAFALSRQVGEGHVRLCLGCPPDRRELTRGLEIVRDMLQEHPDLHRSYF